MRKNLQSIERDRINLENQKISQKKTRQDELDKKREEDENQKKLKNLDRIKRSIMIKEKILKGKNADMPSIKDLFNNDLKTMVENLSKGEDLD